MAAVMRRGLLEVLHDDVLLGMCRCLPARALLDFGACSSELRRRSQDCRELWQALCEFLLGPTAFLLHDEGWGTSAPDAGTAAFYRRMFRSIWSCDSFWYDHRVRNSLLESLSSAGEGEDEAARSSASGRLAQDEAARGTASGRLARRLLARSGHTAEALGQFVVQLGGMQSQEEDVLPEGDCVQVTVIDLTAKRLLSPALAQESARPAGRMRHASCVVSAPFLPPAAVPGAVLMLGGHDGNIRSSSAGQPRASVRSLLLLQLTAEDGSEIRWSEVPATGQAPQYVYNTACASFAGGRRVCLFGGDVPVSDPEFARIRDRHSAGFVYVLDVLEQHWSVVPTAGQVPAWRSFHAAVAHTCLLDGRDYLVTFGGTDEHCEPLSGGSLSCMAGYKLDLQDFTWQKGQSGREDPTARMRFGASRWGRHVLVHGGHNHHGSSSFEGSYVATLNLTTLRWGRVSFGNAAPPLPSRAFETGSPAAGCVVGGARPTARGPQIIARLVVFRLWDPSSGTPDIHQEPANAEAAATSSDDEEDDDALVRVQISGGAAGQGRLLQMPRSVFELLERQAGSQENLTRLLFALVRRQDSERRDAAANAAEDAAQGAAEDSH